MFFKKGVIFTTVFFLVFVTTASTVYSEEEHFSLRALKAEIINAITDARQLADQEPFFLVKKVKLELSGKTATVGEGGFSIPVFGPTIDMGAETGYSSEEKLAIEMKPANQIVVGGEKKINITSLLKDIKETFHREKDASPDFLLTEVVYEKTWALQRSADGKINFVIAKAGGSISEEKKQKIIFTLCETLNFIDCVGQ